MITYIANSVCFLGMSRRWCDETIKTMLHCWISCETMLYSPLYRRSSKDYTHLIQ